MAHYIKRPQHFGNKLNYTLQYPPFSSKDHILDILFDYKQTIPKMLSSAYELITMVASDSLVFLVCNCIIVLLFLGSTLQRPQIMENTSLISPPQFDHSYRQSISERANASSVATYSINQEHKNDYESNSLFVKIEKANLDVNISRWCYEQERRKEKEDELRIVEEEGEEEEEEAHKDELQMRAEEFIKKLKQHWLEEKFGSYVV